MELGLGMGDSLEIVIIYNCPNTVVCTTIAVAIESPGDLTRPALSYDCRTHVKEDETRTHTEILERSSRAAKSQHDGDTTSSRGGRGRVHTVDLCHGLQTHCEEGDDSSDEFHFGTCKDVFKV